MTLHDLVFSEERRIKIFRHSIFWFSWFLYLACTQLRNQTPDQIGMKNFIIYQVGVSANRVVLQMLFFYLFIYWLVPRFFMNKEYKTFATLTILLFTGLYWITYYDYIYIWSDRNSPIFFNIRNVQPLTTFQSAYFAFYSNIHCTGTLVSTTIVLAIKYYKNWYQKERENEILIFQNSQAELQLLKAQVHPHFLFNTLNNIYSLMLDDSPKAVTVLQELSGMAHYMIHEGARPLVPLNKEINMLLDYIGLEKIRYGERLEMKLDVRADKGKNYLIAPLLMIPFVENSFKHGASNSIDKVGIQLFISTVDNWLEFTISNFIFPARETNTERVKIGLNNVKKRLQILYPGNHSLLFQTTEKSFTVNMKIFLGITEPAGLQESLQRLKIRFS